MDTCIIRGLKLEDSSADLLRTLRAVGVRIGVPWMVSEELVAQQVIKYQEAHASASAALEGVARLTPWELDGFLGDADLDRFRKHWRDAYSQLAETVATSEVAMREALFREANALPPCKTTPKGKTGSRDAAIWLSAVEYAREHPDETVYFVSSNTRDFTDGSTYPAPMDEDVNDLGDRFVHLTALDEVIERFTEEVETDQDAVRGALELMASNGLVGSEAEAMVVKYGVDASAAFGPMNAGFELRTKSFVATQVKCASVSDAAMYRIGDREWCTATVEWLVGGLAVVENLSRATATGFIWTTVVLFTPDPEDARLTVLRESGPRPLSEEQLLANLSIDSSLVYSLDEGGPDAPTEADQFITSLLAAQGGRNLAQAVRGLPRAYEGALLRKTQQDARQSAIERRLKGLLNHGPEAHE
ncbi:PIN domain-containing protein [Streptomyces sp. NBC_00268]|uniref:PIN domain-containing protein n=1 Tax=Streptomyces sp. NBC_00268 TaxID=2975695 RepID=UPI00224EA4EF|nr:PIN domain-containing protein [Streptomyces sp. NBC_00268]MCX5182572.1 PIN domain-containing protein [Streptomyces sp. NBC_00268]